MKWIYLGNDSFTCVDDDVYEKVKHINWSVSTTGYACWSSKRVYLHRMVADVSCARIDGGRAVCDHMNRNRLDNRRCNLRVVSDKENYQNVKIAHVIYDKERKKYRVKMRINGVKQSIAQFDDKRDAEICALGAWIARSKMEPRKIHQTPEITEQEKIDAINHAVSLPGNRKSKSMQKHV